MMFKYDQLIFRCLELVTLRSKTYSYLSDNNTVNKKAKGIKSV